jgi:integrase
MIGIQNLKTVKKLPDPLSAAERDLILVDMRERYDIRIYTYFLFMFYTGMRPEEAIALRWGDWDQNDQTIRIQRVRTFKGSERDGSKTGAVRDVDLVPQAIEALKIMAPFTKMKCADIFENPRTATPWHDERSQRLYYWHPTLKRLGIRERRCYATRATYATVALMSGKVNPAYISGQLGHTDAKMLFEKYAKWVNGADKGVQRRAMDAAMMPVEVNELSEVTG